jgi:molecular chaperone DnaK
MYSATQGGPGQPGGPGAGGPTEGQQGGSADNVTDVDYEEVTGDKNR